MPAPTDSVPASDAFRPKPRRPRGLQDRRGAGLAAERALIEKISRIYADWGFEPLETAAFEYADCLGKFLPDQDRPNEGVFALQDDDSQWMALRYDLTAPLARFVAEHFDALPKPYRRWAAGPVWRNEKPGPGRFREFCQCDADTVGAPGPAADAEMIAMACAALEAAGVPRGLYTLKVSTRQLLDGLLAAMAPEGAPLAPRARLTVLRAIDKLDRLGLEGVRLLLGPGRRDESGDFTPGAGLAAAQIDILTAFLDASGKGRAGALAAYGALPFEGSPLWREGLTALNAIHETLAALKVGEDQALFDPAIVRGLEYYTGAVYEAELGLAIEDADGRSVRFGAVGGGGRYDDLVARFRGEPIPATGFSIGVSRLAAALAAGGAGARALDGPVVILALEADQMGAYFAMAQELRAAGVRAEVYLGGAGMRAQMKYADKRAAPLAVIVGGDERAAGQVTIKDLKLGAELAKGIADNETWRKGRPAQITAPRASLAHTVQTMLAGT